MTAAHPSQPGYVPARLVAAASAHRGRHKAGRWSPTEKEYSLDPDTREWLHPEDWPMTPKEIA